MVNPKPLPDRDYLLSRLRYDPSLGCLIWKFRAMSDFETVSAWKVWNKRFARKYAFKSKRKNKYLSGVLDYQEYLAHRVIYKMMHGIEPSAVDHIDGNRENNRIENLRAANHSINSRNVSIGARNKSGEIGVGWMSKQKKWRASVYDGEKAIHLGSFNTKDEAIAARKAANIILGYHANHGRRLQP